MGHSKIENEIHHFKVRLAQRFGIQSSDKLYSHVARLVQEGHSRFCTRRSRRVTIHEVPLFNEWLRIVYDTKRNQAVTVLIIPHHGRRKGTNNGSTPGRSGYCSRAIHAGAT